MCTEVQEMLTAGDKVRSTERIVCNQGEAPRGAVGEVLTVYQSGNARVKFNGIDAVLHCQADELERV